MTGNRLLDRRDVVAKILARRDKAVVISGLGSATYDVAAAGDHDRNFYLWGAMGGTAMIGLGLALAQPDVPVIVMTGDGEMLMGLNSFATIAQQRPRNLTIIVLDNALYGETGMQPTHVASGTDIALVAQACGIADSMTLRGEDQIDALAVRANSVGDSPRVAVVKISAQEHPRVIPIRDGAYIRVRTRLALGLTAD
jgi:thiamine pyrophosphate-dependent acetolactate synthase large subunit-like protein